MPHRLLYIYTDIHIHYTTLIQYIYTHRYTYTTHTHIYKTYTITRIYTVHIKHTQIYNYTYTTHTIYTYTITHSDMHIHYTTHTNIYTHFGIHIQHTYIPPNICNRLSHLGGFQFFIKDQLPNGPLSLCVSKNCLLNYI